MSRSKTYLRNLFVSGITIDGVKIANPNGISGVTASSDELNVLDDVVAGTASASKAAVLGANKNLDTLVIADGGLYLGAAAGTAVTATAAELNILDDATLTTAELNKLDGIAAAAYAVVSEAVDFTETSGAGVWTGAVVVPAGASILDIIIDGIALWNSQTSATLKVGDTDDDGFYTAVDLKATDLLAGESLSFALAGGKAGAYIANSQVSPRYSAVERTINGIITKVGTSGTAGRTRMTVVYSLPLAAPTAATKV